MGCPPMCRRCPSFNADSLLLAVGALIEPGLMRGGPLVLSPEPRAVSYPNGRRREDTGSRPPVPRVAIVPLRPEPVESPEE